MGVNNPHLKSIPEDYKICEPVPDHPLLENVYYPEDIVKGYMWACRFSYCLEPHSPVTILISQQSIGQFASVIKLFYRVEDLAAVVVVVDTVSHFISQEYEKFNFVTKLFHRVEFLAAVVVVVVIVVVVVVTHFTIIMVSSTMLQNCFTGLKTWLQLCRRCLSYLPSSFSCDFLCLALQNAQNKLFSNLNAIFILSQYMVQWYMTTLIYLEFYLDGANSKQLLCDHNSLLSRQAESAKRINLICGV